MAELFGLILGLIAGFLSPWTIPSQVRNTAMAALPTVPERYTSSLNSPLSRERTPPRAESRAASRPAAA